MDTKTPNNREESKTSIDSPNNLENTFVKKLNIDDPKENPKTHKPSNRFQNMNTTNQSNIEEEKHSDKYTKKASNSTNFKPRRSNRLQNKDTKVRTTNLSEKELENIYHIDRRRKDISNEDN
jgi:hypothetical protein